MLFRISRLGFPFMEAQILPSMEDGALDQFQNKALQINCILQYKAVIVFALQAIIAALCGLSAGLLYTSNQCIA